MITAALRAAGGTLVCVTAVPPEVDLLPLPTVAELLAVSITAVHQLVRDGELIAVRVGDAPRGIPAGFVADGAVVKGLPGVIRLLRDNHYDDLEIVDWLHRADDSLPGTPIQALRENRGTEIKRRAQAAGY